MAWNYAFEKDVGRFHIFLEIFSTTESTSRMAEGERAIRQWLWVILECSPYSRRRYLMC